MSINCTDYLFFHKYADFFVYDMRSAYLYPIDILHFEIGEELKAVFQHSGITLNVQYFIQNKKGYGSSIVREHYDFIFNLLSGVDHQEMQTLYNTNRSIYDLIKQAGKETLSINRQFSNTEKFNPRGCYLFANKIFLAANRQIYLCEKSSRKFPFGSFSNNHLRFYVNEINRYYNDFDKVVRNECPDCSLHYMCDRCFFEEPSLMIAPLKCKLPETNIRERLIKSLEHE